MNQSTPAVPRAREQYSQYVRQSVLLTEVGEHALADGGHSHVWLGALHALDGVLILLLAIALVVASLRRMGRRLDPWQSRLLR